MPPRSASPKVHLNDSIPTPPPSPSHTTIPISIAALPPPASSQPTSTTPLLPPIISQATSTTTNIPEPTVCVNTSDTGAPTSETETPVISKPISPSPSSNSFLVLGGDKLEFESYYYSPYRVLTYSDTTVRALIETTLKQIDEYIQNKTKVVDASSLSCKKASEDVATLISDAKILLESLKEAIESNTNKVKNAIESLSNSLQAEKDKFDSVLRSQLLLRYKGEKICKTLQKQTSTILNVTTKPKGNEASGLSVRDNAKGIMGQSDDEEETEEEREKREKEAHDTLVCRQALFPLWSLEKLMKEAIESPSTHWLERVVSFDYENTRDS
ncbi:uncharacterized protein LOC111889514 [Lactuca sativa]|uniref:uncharacterized protein LOC111889514 n=1 Tax=Lactuca sativa TaxID=4236 RepID=UPI000CD883E0|nr:uncharacterized protein LOC111889514 [Lactuca sativa]